MESYASQDSKRPAAQWVWLSAVLSVSACVFPDGFGPGETLGSKGSPPQNDGDYCEKASDCSTEVCTTARVCAPSRCKCSGEECPAAGELSEDCREGWVCTDAKSVFDPVSEFFGDEPAKNKGYCAPLCEVGCPEHYLCEHTFCRADAQWLTPQLEMSWTGTIEGHTTTAQTVPLPSHAVLDLAATSHSAVDVDYQPFRWTIVDGSTGLRVDQTGDATELSLNGATYKRVELTVCDTEHHCATLPVVFEAE